MLSCLQSVKKLHPKSIDLGLSRVTRLLHDLGNPQNKIPNVIHIAGTNGKGSTIAFLADLLRSTGHSVNIYTSPHLQYFAERITLSCKPWKNGQLLTSDDLSYANQIIKNAFDYIFNINNNQPITEFEFITAAAFYIFQQHPADYTILEVGLGGMYDATNVIHTPCATAITSIGFDHTDILDHSIENIATAKAGIIKPSAPIFIPSNLNPLALTVIQETALHHQAPVFITNPLQKNSSLGLIGDHQYCNAGIAVAILKYLLHNQHIDTNILKSTKWKGRLQMVNVTYNDPAKMIPLLLDGAHNVDGIISLVNSIKQTHPHQKMTVFAHIKIRKDYQLMLQYLAPITKKLFVTTFEIDGGESISQDMACDVLKGTDISVQGFNSPQEMQSIMMKEEGPFLATGSLFWVGICLDLAEPLTSESEKNEQSIPQAVNL